MPSGHNNQRLPSWPRANFTFNIVGQTLTVPNANATVPVHLIITNCGSEIISMRGAIPPQVFSKSRWSSIGTIRFSTAINRLFSTNQASCPVARYKLVKDAIGVEYRNANIRTRYMESPPSARMMFNRNTTGTHTFFIRATTEWETVFVDAPFTLKICGEETISVASTKIRHVFKQQRGGLKVASSVFSGNFTTARGELCTISYYGIASRNRTYGTRGRVAMKRARDRTQSLSITRYRPVPLLTFNLTAMTKGLVKGN